MPRSDIFSFGCVLYEILTGKRAFRGDNKATLIAAIIEREPEPLALNKPMLDRVVRTCLAKDPDDRWQSASDLKRELEWILEGGSSAGMPATVLKSRRLNPGYILSGILAALLAAFAIFHFRTAPAPAAVVRFEIPPPEGTHWGDVDFPVLSPDGSKIMFGATRRDGTRNLWIRPMDSVNVQPLPGTDSLFVRSGAWSPDGRSITYATGGGLRRLEMSGGSPQILGSGSARFVYAWSPAGIILFTSGDNTSPLYQILASGGEAKPAMASNDRCYFPSFLPDGRHFLYCTAAGGGVGTDALYAGSLDSKEGKMLTAGSSGVFVPPGWLLYVRGSTLGGAIVRS